MQDGFKPANVYVANNIAFFDDVQAYFRERSAAEKRYSAELSAIAKKYYDKKAKKSTSLSVGDTPTMTPGSLERYDKGLEHGHICLGVLCQLTDGFPCN